MQSPSNQSQLTLEGEYVGAKKEERQEEGEAPANGIYGRWTLLGIGILIILSLSLVDTSNNQLNGHLRAMQNYFNLRLLDHDDFGIYDQGDTLDEPFDELVLLDDMRKHLI